MKATAAMKLVADSAGSSWGQGSVGQGEGAPGMTMVFWGFLGSLKERKKTTSKIEAIKLYVS